MDIRDNYSLRNRNTFGIDVRCDRFIEFSSETELSDALGHIRGPHLTIGEGSNLLFMHDFEGTILHSRISSVEIVSDTPDCVLVRAGSGVIWDSFVAWCVRHGLWGAENLSSIPGQTGASAVQNIGAYGVEVADIIESVRAVNVYDGSIKIFTNKECCYAYRDSIFKGIEKGRHVITYVTYRLSRTASAKLGYGALQQKVEEFGDITLENIRKAVATIRSEKLPDPAVTGNAGSFFKNPVVGKSFAEMLHSKYPDMPQYETPDGKVKLAAGWLIEKCGWKGRSMGCAAVHDRQALVLVNLGGASGQDIKDLADAVTSSVYDIFGIRLETEVNYI